jgi:hypothetical protein
MLDAPAQEAFGAYVSGEYQFARRWYAGGRLDHSGASRTARRSTRAGRPF